MSLRGPKSCNWCFTLNNPEGTELPFLPASLSYVVWQLERGESGTPHFQGYAEFKSRQELSALKKWLPAAHWEVRKGSQSEARDYCMKEDSRVSGPWEHGVCSVNQPGRRSDLERVAEMIKEDGVSAAIDAFPAEYIKFSKGFGALARHYKKRPLDADFVPRTWQKAVLDFLLQPADPRSIVWVHSTRGEMGKSRFAHHLLCEHNAIELHGKVSDMAYGYNEEPIVVIDLARTQADNVKHLYEFAEKLKNGAVYSPKYESGLKMFPAPHVVFFANFAPPGDDVWSVDRVVEVDLHNPRFKALLEFPESKRRKIVI